MISKGISREKALSLQHGKQMHKRKNMCGMGSRTDYNMSNYAKMHSGGMKAGKKAY